MDYSDAFRAATTVRASRRGGVDAWWTAEEPPLQVTEQRHVGIVVVHQHGLKEDLQENGLIPGIQLLIQPLHIGVVRRARAFFAPQPHAGEGGKEIRVTLRKMLEDDED